jgi:predicted MFS family arabinose efflux permease
VEIAAVWTRFTQEERATLEPLRYAPFRRAFSARIVSSAGSWMQAVAAGWLMFELTRSAVSVGVLTLLSRAPGILAAYGGTLVDRYDPRRLAAALFAAQLVPPAILAVLAWDNDTSTASLYVLALAGGVGGALAVPVFPSLVAGTVPGDLLGKANGLSSVGYSIAGLAGPLIGGALVSAVGAGACFAINALSYAVMVGVVLTLPAVGPKAAQAARGLRPALQVARRGTAEFRILVALVLFALLVGPVQELSPAIARRHGDGAHILGYLLAALAAGGLIGNFLIGRPDLERARRRVLSGMESLVFSATLILLAVSGGLGLAMLAMFMTGVAWQAAFVQLLTWIQYDSPPEVKGRMLGLFFAGYLAALSLGALIVGAGFDAIGIEDALLLCAAGVAGFGVFLLVDSRRPVKEPPPIHAGHKHQ